MTTSFDEFASDYQMALNQGLSLSGETADFFARRRLEWLSHRLPTIAPYPFVLDFGCGTGGASGLLSNTFNAKLVVGVDVSEKSLGVASQTHRKGNIAFRHRNSAVEREAFDLAYTNGVFHHIPPAERAHEIAWIFERLKPGGYFALWENNPWNVGTRWVMSRIPFDRDAVLVWPREARRLLRDQGFEVVATDFCFIFPRLLAGLRPLEPWASKLPIGAQYLVLARKPFAPSAD